MIVGIDAALRATGIAVLSRHSESLDLVRYETISVKKGGIEVLIDAALQCAEMICSASDVWVEWPPEKYSGRKPQVRLLAAAGAVFATALRARSCDVHLVTPAEWGVVCSGPEHAYAHALAVCRARGWRLPTNEHEADALCIALHGMGR